ncbi:MAG TPA: UTP--glucose-1-phosphate uridylyltransferase [Tepidisphaeraceae bacterium]
MSQLLKIITSSDDVVRNVALDVYCRGAGPEVLIAECAALDEFRRTCPNLYERVRALFFLYAIHRFHLPQRLATGARGAVPFDGYNHLLSRRFEEAIEVFLGEMKAHGPSDGISSALAASYKELAFATLANQVRRSVRSVRGNQWMFRVGHPADQPLRVRPELMRRNGAGGLFPVLTEKTPVRMDLSHSAWSDIFFLGMDFPEGARVLNVSIDLAVRGRDAAPKPPVESYFRVIDEPVLRLVSVDLGAKADISSLPEVFDFGRDYLGLLKAAIIAAGVVPPGMEGSGQSLEDLLARLVGPGLGLEIVSNVNSIPKGSRLAVSTNLLASLISVCMRATGQARSLTGQLAEEERRLVAARAILGEWLGGSGGGWQDSGGVWPGMKLITGAAAREEDPEHGISRGRLMPNHHILSREEVSPETRQKLQDSLVLVHGGMAQNVGPILEMVTEKYLLRSDREWQGRKLAMSILDQIVAALARGDIAAVGELTTCNFRDPLQTIIPWASNFYTETLIRRTREKFNGDFQGFWMLGGMSGGGMGFIFSPQKKAEAQAWMGEMMSTTRQELQHALPFAIEPVVYDFAINERGTYAQLLEGEQALLPPGYYAIMVPHWLRSDPAQLSRLRRAEMDAFGNACRQKPELSGMVQILFDRLFPAVGQSRGEQKSLTALLSESGFDSEQHERIRTDLRNGRIGLAQNRLPASTVIRDVEEGDVIDTTGVLDPQLARIGAEALARGEAGVVSLAAGAGSRWTQGAGVVKALHPFAKLGGKHRSFIEVHLAKSRRTGKKSGVMPAHIVSTSYLTHLPIADYLLANGNYGYQGPLHLSPGRAIGLRMIPMERDLRFAWEEMPQKRLDEQQEKMRESVHAALIGWAKSMGEASDYTDNVANQCLHPVGHWYEIPNLLRNGVLLKVLTERPALKYLMLHNIDTLGADLDPALLGLHMSSGAALTFEVIGRRIEDRGGGLARVNGKVRLLEGLAMPREEDEFALSYYNTMTTWIDVAKLLATFGLSRSDLTDEATVSAAVRHFSARVPTYLTLKDVKKRWGHGQEDVYPVAQWEKLWGDMSAVADVSCAFAVVKRERGQQLKEQAQLDGWVRDGSAAYVEALCEWE